MRLPNTAQPTIEKGTFDMAKNTNIQTLSLDKDLLTILVRLNGLLEGLAIISREYDFDGSKEANAIIVNIDEAVEKSQLAVLLADKQELKIVA